MIWNETALVEGEHRAAVEGGERLPVQLEIDRHHGSRRPSVDLLPGLAVTGDGGDLRVPEYAGVVLRGFFGLGVEPQARNDRLRCCHDGPPSR
jgi:hypothetical protein